MQMDCASIILPITPPALFAAPIRIGLRFNCCAVMRCNPPKSALEEVSLPVNATPSHPINVPKKGKNHPVRVNASPSTASMPEYRVTYPNPSMHDIAIIANRMRYTVFPKIRKSRSGLNPRIVPASSAARKHPDPVDVNQLKSNLAFSAVGFATTGCARDTALWRYGKSHPPRLK